jgi:hypothetical protein
MDKTNRFGCHYHRLVEQGINVDDRYLQITYFNAQVRYTPEQLEEIIGCFEQKNSLGAFHTPNGALCSALQRGWWL